MIKNKIFLTFVLLLFGFSLVNAQDCYFKSFNEDCQRITSPYNTFTLTGLNSLGNYEKYDAEIYNTKNPSNKLKFTQDNFNLMQISPFLEPAAYTIKIKAYDKSSNIVAKEFEYIFDNLEPMPPIVDLKLNNVNHISGKAEPNTILFADISGSLLQTTVSADGTFNLQLIGLDSGYNYVKFYIEKNNGMKSQIVERVFLSGNTIIEDNTVNFNLISLDNLEQLNEKTYAGYTTKRNFYVRGRISSNIAGAPVYVNGIKTLTDENGEFTSFILLNEGNNQIIAKSKNVESTPYNIKYVNMKYQILDFNAEKIVSEDSAQIQGKSNFAYPFHVFLNGQYLLFVEPDTQDFDFTLNSLKPGKNYLEIRGINNQKISEIIYYDTHQPQAQLLSAIKLANPQKLIFEISDDIGINLESLTLTIDSNIINAEKLNVNGNFYIYDISDLVDGSYDYILSGKDLSGKDFAINGQFGIDKKNTLIKDMILEGDILGNKIFLKSGQVELILTPSRNIAFKSIFLDGIEQTNYEILRDNSIKLKLNIENQQGTLDFKFINNEYVEFTQNYTYFSDERSPQIELEYVSKPYSADYVKISGEIKDDYFDWSSLKLNSQNSFTKYGNNFEAVVSLTRDGKDNVMISGYDHSRNSFSQNYGSLIYKDTTQSVTYLDINSIFNRSLSGNLNNNNEADGVLNFIGSYDGFDFSKVYLGADSFNLPLQQRYGLRSLNLKGKESSDNSFSSIQTFSVPYSTYTYSQDGSIPEIYFSGNDMKTDKSNYFIQGQFKASSNITSLTVLEGGNCQHDDFNFVCQVTLNEGINTFNVKIIDGSGQQVTKDISIDHISPNLIVSLNDVSGDYVFESGGKYYLTLGEFDIEGNVNKQALIKAIVDGQELYFENRNGTFVLPIDISNEISAVEAKEVNVKIEAQDEFGNRGISENIKMLYQRVFKTFAKVVLR